jgi:hypothetical protein
VAAASSKVIVCPVVATAPPASDQNTYLSPFGPTSKKLWSLVLGKLTLVKVTVTFEIVPLRPETTMLEGYGTDVPPPASGMLMPPAFVKVLPTTEVGNLTAWVKLELLVENVALPT